MKIVIGKMLKYRWDITLSHVRVTAPARLLIGRLHMIVVTLTANSHICDGIHDGMDRSDESGCESRAGKEVINMAPGMEKMKCQPLLSDEQIQEIQAEKTMQMRWKYCSDSILFRTVYPQRCPMIFVRPDFPHILKNGEDKRCNDTIMSGIHESRCSNSQFDNYTHTKLRLISFGENECTVEPACKVSVLSKEN